jgi:bacterioferritin (cytochrome b1)
MKGNEKLIGTLNSLLADELTAINQYMVHSEMCSNWVMKSFINISKNARLMR